MEKRQIIWQNVLEKLDSYMQILKLDSFLIYKNKLKMN